MARDAMGMAADYTHTIIDGPARGQDIAHSVVIASDLVVVPIEPGGPSLWAASETIEAVNNGRALKEALEAVFLVSRKHGNTVIGREAKAYAADAGIPILKSEIQNRVAYAEALTAGRTILEWAAKSEAAKDIDRLVKELLRYGQHETFADMKKPVRRPTPEEIAAFEETGRAIARANKVAAKADRKSGKAETREHANTENRESVNTESSMPAKPRWRPIALQPFA